MKAGDTVRDSITGETWVLAFYDEERDEAGWCGWPEGCAANASGRLTVVESCSEEASDRMLREWAGRGGDVRAIAARQILGRRR